MTIKLPDTVRRIIESLERGGFEACAVGGCVRDSLLGRAVHDWDPSPAPGRRSGLAFRTAGFWKQG